MCLVMSVVIGAMSGSCVASQDRHASCTVGLEIDSESQRSFETDLESYAAMKGMEYVLRLEPLMRPTHRFGLRNDHVEVSGLNTLADGEYRFFFFAKDPSAEAEATSLCGEFSAFVDALAYARLTAQ
jgi:hypothetical protein